MGNSYFQWQRDEEKMVGGNQELRTSILIREHPIQGEGQRDFLGESESSPPPPLRDSLRDASEAINDFWSMSGNFIYRHPPRRWTQSQILLAEIRIISFSIGIHWRLQNYTYKLGCYARNPHRWSMEYRWIKRLVWFLDRFHSVYSIKWEFPEGSMRSGRDSQNGKRHPGHIIYGQNSG